MMMLTSTPRRAALIARASHVTLADAPPLALSLQGREYEGLLHRDKDILVLELELKPDASEIHSTMNKVRNLSRMLQRLQGAKTLTALYEICVREIQALTGYDRVLIYRFQDEGHGLGIQTGVDGIEHGPGHGHAEMGLEHFGDIGGDDRDGIARPQPAPHQRARNAPAAVIGFGPVPAQIAIKHRKRLGIDLGRALDEAQGRKLFVIRRTGIEALLVDLLIGHSSPLNTRPARIAAIRHDGDGYSG